MLLTRLVSGNETFSDSAASLAFRRFLMEAMRNPGRKFRPYTIRAFAKNRAGEPPFVAFGLVLLRNVSAKGPVAMPVHAFACPSLARDAVFEREDAWIPACFRTRSANDVRL